jgi:GTP-binding protein LepA
MDTGNIRNFSIIAHIDHGKSTLADRLLELTGTIEKRKMQAQVLDQMELERERGITIKMQPVRMEHKGNILNLIDTPGHIDFSYEVSRALQAVEGTILLVDATQGVQAQTITTVEMAKELGLVIIPVMNKIDLDTARIEETKEEIIRLLGCDESEILAVSAKTGEGAEELLEEVIKKIPAPKFEHDNRPRGLIFDFEYSNHQGVIVYLKVADGVMKKGDKLFLSQTKEKFIVGEVGVFSPTKKQADKLSAGEIGYVVTAIKKPSVATVGDSVVAEENPLPPLPGYEKSRPVVWASIYPESQDEFDDFKKALEKLSLSDSAITYEPESGGALVPDNHLINKVFEPWVDIQIITPPDMIGQVMQVLFEHEAIVGATDQFGDFRSLIKVQMPLREMMRNFFDELKSATSGYASLSYKIADMRETVKGSITRLDVLIAEEVVPAFSRVVSSARIEREAKEVAEKLKNILPKALFTIKIQVKGLGRILASRSISALKKDVTGHLYGGDITRKMKLREKQKKGKKKMLARGKVNIPHDIFVKMMQN